MIIIIGKQVSFGGNYIIHGNRQNTAKTKKSAILSSIPPSYL